MRSPITGMVIQYQSLTPEEQKVFLDLVDPQPEPEAPKKVSKKRGPRSPRASGMAAAIKNSIEQGQQAAAAAASRQKCTATVPGLDVECGQPEDSGIHDPNGGYGGYHEFETTAPVAAKKPSRNSTAIKV